MSEQKTMHVVMQRNGTYDDTESVPIRTFRDKRDAERMAANKNRDAAVIIGKIAARNIMFEHWDDTHAHHVDPDVKERERSAEEERLTILLGIKADCEALGFRDEYDMDQPHWSVIEVPHGDD